MAFNFGNRNELQMPGAGLPKSEHAILNVAFKIGCSVLSDARALKIFSSVSTKIHQLVDNDESFDAFQPLLIPRVIGIEDSSRNWSAMMVVEHLCQTNTDMLKVIQALMDGVVPRGEIDVALYKPEEDLSYETLDRYLKIKSDYEQTIGRLLEEHGSLESKKRYAHPWFGKLNAHQWHCLTAVHQRIHRRQLHKLIAMLGVA
jgi:hypothetical protein